MSFISGVEDPCISAWSPKSVLPNYLLTGSYEGVYSTGNERNVFDLYSLQNDELKKVQAAPIISTAYSLVWSPTTGSPMGSIVAGHSEGRMGIYSPENLLNGIEPMRHVCARHTGAVSTIDANPFQPNLIASGAQSSEIFIWDLNSPDKPMTPGSKIQPLSPINRVAWNAKVQHILGTLIGLPSGSQAVIWDLRKNEPIIKIQDRTSRLISSAMAWNPLEPTQFAIGSEDDERPIIQLWDVRHAQQPYQTIQGHQKGITDLVWNKTDPRFILSSGKDGRSILFNSKTGEIMAEMPQQPGFIIHSRFSPRHEQLVSISSAESGTSVYNILGVPSAAKLQTTKQAAALDDAFGAPVTSAEPTFSSDQEKVPDPITTAPKWIGRKAGANFGFGGRLVQFGVNSEIKINQVLTEKKVVDESKLLLSSLEQNITNFCQNKIENASEGDKEIWNYIHARTQSNSRDAFFNLLDVITLTLPPPAAIAPTPTPPLVEDKLAEEESSSFDVVEPQQDDDPFATISQANAEQVLEPAPEQPPTEQLQKLTFTQVPPPSSFAVPTGTCPDSRIAENLMVADFETAVDCCLAENRFADAFIIARIGGDELLQRTIDTYSNLNTTKISQMMFYINSRNWADFVAKGELKTWRQILGTLITYCEDASALNSYAEILGDRLETSDNPGTAALCYIVSGNIDKLVKNIKKFGNSVGDEDKASYLQETVEKILILRKTENSVAGSLSNSILQKYAFLLSSQGQFKDALSFLVGSDENDPQIAEMNDRLGKNTTEPMHHQVVAQQPVATHPSYAAQTSTATSNPYQKANRKTQQHIQQPPTNHFQPPTQPAVSFQPMVPQPMVPQPMTPMSQPMSHPMSQPMSHPMSQPMSHAHIPTQIHPPAVQPIVSQPPSMTSLPSVQAPAMPSQPMTVNEPIPTQHNTFTPPFTSSNTSLNNQPNSLPQSSGGMPPSNFGGYGGGYGQPPSADISHIPTGPAPDRKKMTAGWNDPRAAPTYSDKPIDNSMRIVRKKKKTVANIIPEDVQGFVPAPQPVNQPMGMGGMMRGAPPMMGSASMGIPPANMGVPPSMGGQPPMGGQPGMSMQPSMGMTPSPMGVPPHMSTAPSMGAAPMGVPPMSAGPAMSAPPPTMGGSPVGQLGIPPANMMAQGMPLNPATGDPAEPTAPNSGAAKVQKLPIPEQFLPIQKSFDDTLQRCLNATNLSPLLKKKLDDSSRRLQSLYDKLRNQTLSKPVTDGLFQIATSLDGHDYQQGLGLVQWIVQKANFSEVSSFLPGIKNLTQIAAQLQV